MQVQGRSSRFFFASVLLLSVAFALGGCDEDDDGPAGVDPVYDHSTPAGVATALRDALAAGDAAELDALLAADATLVFAATEAADRGWPSQMGAGELTAALAVICNGATVTVATFTEIAPFAPAGAGAPFAGSLVGEYALAFSAEWEDHQALSVASRLRLYVAADPDKAPSYRILGIAEQANEAAEASLGAFLVGCLANQPPIAALAVDPATGGRETVFTFDASASADGETPDELVFRWGGDLTDEDNWTEWSSEPHFSRAWSTTGVKVGLVEVRDRWGAVDQVQVGCDVTGWWADSPDDLMALFETAYENMDEPSYVEDLLSPDYRFVIEDETVDRFGLPSNIFTFEHEQSIVAKMFHGIPNSAGRAIGEIQIAYFEPQGVWQPVPLDDFYFGGSESQYRKWRNFEVLIYFVAASGEFRYEVHGGQIFYVDAELDDTPGEPTLRYRLIGQRDLTGWNGGLLPATESSSWSSVKALFQ